MDRLVEALLSPIDAVRQQAEASLETIKITQPDTLLTTLLQILYRTHNVRNDISCMCAVVLRNTLTHTNNRHNSTNASEACRCMQHLVLHGKWLDRTTRTILAEICLVVDRNRGMDLVSQLIRSEEPNNRLLAIKMAANVVVTMPEMEEVIAYGLCKETDLEVRLEAVKALSEFQHVPDWISYPVLESMFELFQSIFLQERVSCCEEILTVFSGLAWTSPEIFRNHLTTFVGSMGDIVCMKSAPFCLRRKSMEILLGLCDFFSEDFRLKQEWIQLLLVSSLDMILSSFPTDSGAFSESDELREFGEEALDHIGKSLGNSVYATFKELAYQGSRHSVWAYRYAILQGITQLSEAFKLSEMKPLIDDIVLPALNDDVFDVQYAAIHACGQISSDLAPDFQVVYIEKLLPSLMCKLDSILPDAIQAHSAAAIVNFVEFCSSNMLLPFMEKLLSLLSDRIALGERVVREESIAAVASIASATGAQFEKYYDVFVPILRNIVTNCFPKKKPVDIDSMMSLHGKLMLRGRAIECMAIIGSVVSTQRFQNDAKYLMELSLRQTLNLRSVSFSLLLDDPSFDYVLRSWIICFTRLKEFLSEFVPQILDVAVEVASLSMDIPLEETVTACSLINALVQLVPSRVLAKIDSLVQLLSVLVSNQMIEIRRISIATLPVLCTVSCGRLDDVSCKSLFIHAVNILTTRFSSEESLFLQVSLLEGLAYLLESAYEKDFSFPINACQAIFQVIVTSLTGLLLRQNWGCAETAECIDEEAIREILLYEPRLSRALSKMISCIISISKTNPEMLIQSLNLIRSPICRLASAGDRCPLVFLLMEECVKQVGPLAIPLLSDLFSKLAPEIHNCTSAQKVLCRCNEVMTSSLTVSEASPEKTALSPSYRGESYL